MKKIIFLSIVLFLIATYAAAQSVSKAPPNLDRMITTPPPPVYQGSVNQYPGATGTITRTGYTYKYRNPIIFGVEATSRVELYNAVDSYLDVEWGYADGTKATFEELMGQVLNSEYISDSSQTIMQTLAMVDGQFTTQQKNTLRGKSMVITVRFDPSTGRIADVYFKFFRDSPFAKIPVETYRSVELALKENLTVTMTAKGKRQIYDQLVWEQEF